MAAGCKPSQDRDLRTGRPVWGRAAARRTDPPPAGLRVDVAVVGGGISGALATDALLRAGLSVAVFDRRGLAQGSTSASTALVQFELDKPLSLLARQVGRDAATRVWWRSAAAVETLRGRIRDLKIGCGFAERHTLYLPGNVLDAAGLAHEARLRARIGLRSGMIGGADIARLAGIGARAAIWSSGAAELDPLRLTRGLWRSAAARGAQLFHPVEVAGIEPGRTGVSLRTDAGRTVRAGHVVLATGYELAPMLRPVGYRVISTWALATPRQKPVIWPSRCLVWQAADPYLYVRSTPDGRVIAGGEDEEFFDDAARDRLLPAKTKAIARKLSRLMPGIAVEPEFAWTGSFGSSDTGMPAIGPVPRMQRVFAVLGFGGNGITFSALAADLVTRAIVGVRDPDAGLFALRQR